MYGNNVVGSTGNEMSLGAFADIVCFECKEKGHKSYQCPKKKGKRRFNGKCNNCGKTGHKDATCWEKEENADKCPKNWKSSLNNTNNTGNTNGEAASVCADGVEFLLCGLTFPTKVQMLKDENVWIADTGASVHTSPHKLGMVNLRQPSASDAITVGNGTTESAGMIGDLPGTVCDKFGNEQMTATIKDITILPNGEFNLFSVTKLQKDGWLLRGDSTCIELTKNG